jgi:hypothetical protein
VHASALAEPIQKRETTEVEPATRIVIAEPADVEPKLLGYHGTISYIRNNLDGTPPSRRQWLSPSPVSEVYSGSPQAKRYT